MQEIASPPSADRNDTTLFGQSQATAQNLQHTTKPHGFALAFHQSFLYFINKSDDH